MKSTRIVLWFVLIFLGVSPGVSFAYRLEPAYVQPVEYQGLRFEAPHNKRGYIEARDAKTNELLWEKRVYYKPLDPRIEADNQWVFITALEIAGNKLVVRNEAGEQFLFELSAIKDEVEGFSAMLKKVLQQYPFLAEECRVFDAQALQGRMPDNCGPPKNYLFYDENEPFLRTSIEGQHFLPDGLEVEVFASAKFSAPSCAPTLTTCDSSYFIRSEPKKGFVLEEVPAEEFYRFLMTKGHLMKVYSYQDVRIIENVK
jgi:hypothetical protein